MTIRPLLILASTAALFTAACKNSPSAATSSHEPVAAKPANGAAPVKGEPADDRTNAVDALRRKTEDYSREMDSLVLAKSNPQPAPQQSRVDWNEPDRSGLSLAPKSTDAPSSPQSGGDRAIAASEISTGHATDPSAQNHTHKAIVAMANDGAAPHISPSVSTDALEDRLSRRIKEYPRDASAQFEYQLVEFLKDEPTPQLQVLSGLTAEDREMVVAVLDGLSNFRNTLRADNNVLLSKKVRPLLEMSDRLRAQAELTIPTIQLCTSVTRFGIYEPITSARFPAGRENQMIVYCEMANFTSNLNDKHLWETRLTWDMSLYKAEDGMSVWSEKTQNVMDNSRTHLRDFFVRKAITLPGTLPIGRYLLKATIVDQQSNRVAEATVPLVIAAQ